MKAEIEVGRRLGRCPISSVAHVYLCMLHVEYMSSSILLGTEDAKINKEILCGIRE